MNLSDRSLITVSGGLQNCGRGGGRSEVLPLHKKGGGGCFSHAARWGGGVT